MLGLSLKLKPFSTTALLSTLNAVPAGAIQMRNNDYILDRDNNFIEVRA